MLFNQNNATATFVMFDQVFKIHITQLTIDCAVDTLTHVQIEGVMMHRPTAHTPENPQ
jgi:hypothetical protein